MTDTSAAVALITGAATPIGAAVARRLHAAGHAVLLHYDQAEEAALSLAMSLNTERNQSAHCLQADLLDREQLERLTQAALAHWGRLDLLVNHATAFLAGGLESASEQDWQRLIGRNLKAPWCLAQRLAPALRESAGCLINLGDVESGAPQPGRALYSLSLAALEGLTPVLATELGPRVRVLGLAAQPGTGETGLSPVEVAETLWQLYTGRLGEAGQVYRLAACPIPPCPGAGPSAELPLRR